MIKRLLITVLLPCILGSAAIAQERLVRGKVTSADDGSPLPGVSVVVQGTTKGMATDSNGEYSLSLQSSEDVLIFSFVGYKTATVQVGAQSVIDIVLEDDIAALEEVVVVGYGVQKEKDLTSAITTIKSADIIKTPQGQAMQALQGKVPGLQVVSSGAPGASPTIRVRGVGSYPGNGTNNENPLYVVDGMFFDNIDFLSPADIESISILKDASSSAIYGVRASNGVVLIKTKSGAFNQKAQIVYNGYYGTQRAQNVLKMANAEQFTTMANESGSTAAQGFIQNAMQRYGRSRINPNVPDVNTDWYKEILRPASIQSHNLSISGGDNKATYSVGGDYFSQDGILDMKNDYERFNLRVKLDYHANDWLTIGGNVVMSNATRYDQNPSAWALAYFAVPIMPVYDELNTAATPINFSNAQDIGYRDGQNPRVATEFTNNLLRIRKTLANFYIKTEIVPNRLTFQTTYNVGNTFLNERKVNLPYFIGNSFNRQFASLEKKTETTINQIWDNVLTYNQDFGNHNLTVVGGMSFRDESFEMLRAGGTDLVDVREEAWYLDNIRNIDVGQVEDEGRRVYGLSYFGRVAYNFSEKYLLYGTIRADGTSKYQEKWGVFPAVGAGWVISEENFLQGNSVVDFLKIRGGWGRLGNDRLNASSGTNTTSLVDLALNGVLFSGTVSDNTFNYLTWESTDELNVGFTSRLLKNKLSVDADYFIRDTKDAVIQLTAPLTGQRYLRNSGEIRNSGFELALNWTDQLAGDLTYNVGFNMATLNNEVRDLFGQAYIDGGTAEFRQRSIVGNPLLAFFGLQVDGVYQTAEQVAADPAAVVQNTAAPGSVVAGDFKYKDQNNDGVINGDDRVVLGSYLPKFTYGANIGASYKNFDFSLNVMGQQGNKILNRKRGQVIFTADANIDADLAVNRWHGEGTSNVYPSSAGLRKSWNQQMSDYFVEDGSFFRIQNIQLAYNIRGKQLFGKTMPETRVSLTADRPLTVFNYNGFNPEVENGIDTQTYPIPAVYTVGLNVKF
jgi:TonB-dependent starch-binding outer membrane protein SusC